MLPFVSVSRIWSIVRAISSPATGLPATRWDSISLRVRLLATRVQRAEGAAGRADVVAARPDEPGVVVPLDDNRLIPPRGDHVRLGKHHSVLHVQSNLLFRLVPCK